MLTANTLYSKNVQNKLLHYFFLKDIAFTWYNKM